MFQNSSFAATSPNLGTANTYGVVASSTITNDGTFGTGTTINGDLALTGSSVTGFFGTNENDGPGTVTGTIHQTDATATTVLGDAQTAFDALNAKACDDFAPWPNNNSEKEMDGLTLVPGVYCSFTSSSLHLAGDGTLTLDGPGVYIFKADSTLVTVTGSNVILTNGATADNVFWYVGSAATLAAPAPGSGNTSVFPGTVIASAAISQTGGDAATLLDIEGRLFSLNGGVSFASTTHITVPEADVTVPEEDVIPPTTTTTSSSGTSTNAPNPPDNFSIQAVSDDQINLSWSAPYDWGFPITGYMITYVVDEGEFVELDTIDGSITNYSHKNLLQDHIYFYQISAINSVGQSTPTKFLSSTTLGGTSVPNSPTSLQANIASPTSVFLYWDAPQNNDSIITGYMIEYGTITNQWHVLVSNTGTPQASYHHSGIDAGKNYDYRVSAINSNGVGSPSNVVSVVPQATYSPTVVSILANPTQVQLNWLAPSYTYGERIIGYSIDTKIDDDVYASVVENTGLVTSYTISELTTDKKYTFRLTALFDGGTQSIHSQDVSVIPSSTSYYPIQTQNYLPSGSLVYTGQQSPPSTTTVEFTNPGPQTQYFQSPNTDINGIWATVSTYVNGAVLYFNSEGNTYSLEIPPNSNTWIIFNNSVDVSNVRLNIDGRLYSSDIGRIGYMDLDAVTPSSINNLPSGSLVYTGQQSPSSLNTVEFSNPGPQTKNFQFPDIVSKVNGIWATVSTYVNGAVLYFDSEGKTYSLEILPNSNTWIVFDSPTTISNTRISIDGRGYSSDIGSVSYVTPDVAPRTQSTPDAPMGLHANLYYDDTVQLTWVSSSNIGKYPVSGYVIEYKTNSDSNWSVLSQNNGLQTILIHSGLLDNKTYMYRVSAMNFFGVSDPSNTASVTTGKIVQPTPTNTYSSSGILPIFNTDTSISYAISGGKVLGVVLDRDATSLDFMLKGETTGILYAQLSRTLIDAIQSNESDRSFFVTVDGVNAQFTEIKTDDYRNMVISFPSGANNISIIGTSVVPEFGTIDKEYVLPEPGTTPDSFVYGFKKAFEGLDLSFTFNQNDKVAKHLKFAELRLSEAKAMVQKGMPELVDDLTKDYEKQVSGAKQIANSASESVNKAALTETIMLASSKHIQVLTSLKDTLPEQAQLRIQVIIDNSKKDIGIAMKESSNRAADAMVKSEEMKKIAEYNKP